MVLAMTRPYQHSKTGTYWIRKAVPAALRATVGKRELKVSLRTKDPATARGLAPAALDKFNLILTDASEQASGQISLRQIDAVMGQWYRAEAAKWADNPGSLRHWEDVASYYSEMFPREPGEPAEFETVTFVKLV